MENVTKVIDKTVVGKTMPTNPNTLWIDTSNGEKNAVLKYKGYPLVGGGSGSGGGGSTGGYLYNQPIPLTPTRDRTEEDLAKLPQLPDDNWSYDSQVVLLEGGLIPNKIIEQRDEDVTVVIPFKLRSTNPLWADGPTMWVFGEPMFQINYRFVPSFDGSFMIRCYYSGGAS